MAIFNCYVSSPEGITNIFLIPAGNETWLAVCKIIDLNWSRLVPLPCLRQPHGTFTFRYIGVSKIRDLQKVQFDSIDAKPHGYPKNNHMINPHAILNHPKPADLRILYGTVVFVWQTCFTGTLVPDGFEFVLNMLEWDSRPQAAGRTVYIYNI